MDLQALQITVLQHVHSLPCLHHALLSNSSQWVFLCFSACILLSFATARQSQGYFMTVYCQSVRLGTEPPEVLSSLRPYVGLMQHPHWLEDGFVCCDNAWTLSHVHVTYRMIVKIPSFRMYTSPLPVQALQSRSCLSYLAYATTAA
jgi:hypothetical protein